MNKKIIAFAATFALTFGAVGLPAVESWETVDVSASASTATYGDYNYTVLSDGTVEIAKYNGSDKTVKVPSEIKGKAVTSIGSFAFSESQLTKIIIPDSVKSIGTYAFNNCMSLTNVTLPDSITNIGEYAFICCTGLTSISIPKSVTNIEAGAFGSCANLKSVTLSDGIKSIGESAFYSCMNLKNVTIPKSVTSIGDKAFGYMVDVYSGVIKIDGFKITCYSGTAAEKYAKNSGFTYETIKAISSSKTKVTGIKSTYTYTGKLIKPTVTVKYGTTKLKNGTDYKVTYKNNKSAGTATVIITGTNGYTGTVKKTFKILPATEKITGIRSPKTKQIKVAWSKNSQATGYQILYSSKSNFSTYAKATAGKSETAKTITKSIVKGRTYYVKVRAYKKVGSTYYFGKFSAVKKVTAK